MQATTVIADGIERIRELVESTASGLDDEALSRRPTPASNSIGWLLWHLTRIEDSHVAELAGQKQLYVADGYAARLGLRPDDADTGYGHTPADVGAVRISESDEIVAYHDAVASRSLSFLATVRDDELDEIVDEGWDPPVTAGVRWVSILGDCYQHAGQAAYLKGLFATA